MQVVDGDGEDGLLDHLLDHAALHLHQVLVGDLRHRRELVRRQAVQLVAGLTGQDLQAGLIGAGKIHGWRPGVP